ncbi:hypothetical protein H8L32_21700 [Undibacterium sp. CY18W]|uniref:Uncharacterized protein n=1 Tax=Undibacterium hunanense TaxID=2762292 RepID=A0ABR6ZW49_9BURK|nr:hypothetical protein [Undibacterium hunanense]MBC3920097.1 hypothetical protein [Undibacterium hunanense]
MESEEDSIQEESKKNEFLTSLITLLKEVTYSALIIISLSAIELLANCTLHGALKNYIVTVHEWSTGGVFFILAAKSLLRVAARGYREIRGLKWH